MEIFLYTKQTAEFKWFNAEIKKCVLYFFIFYCLCFGLFTFYEMLNMRKNICLKDSTDGLILSVEGADLLVSVDRVNVVLFVEKI